MSSSSSYEDNNNNKNNNKNNNNNNEIILLDASSTSITVSWPDLSSLAPNSTNININITYTLQYRSESDTDFTTLSEKLSSTQAKKNNLTLAKSPFYFRVRHNHQDNDKDNDNDNDNNIHNWCTHSTPFHLMEEEKEKKRMKPIQLSASQGNYAIVLHWEPFDDNINNNSSSNSSNNSSIRYEVQMRESSKGGSPWKTIAGSLATTTVKKKNLLPNSMYQFRVRPNIDINININNDNNNGAMIFSPPSESVTPIPLSLGMERLFQNLSYKQLQQPNSTKNSNSTNKIHIHQALTNKVVLLYASAHWCPPCRQFTPQLIQFYKRYASEIEIIFVSCDHDEEEFENYFSTMPWKAIPYDDSFREELLGRIKVKGIPRLVVLNSATGGMLVENAVGGNMNVEHWKRGQK